jgi:hypothetical protein
MRDGASAYLPIGAGVVCAIRARTRAQIQSTQIVRPRPHRTRGGPVEGPRGTGACRSSSSTPTTSRWTADRAQAIVKAVANDLTP